MWLHETRGSITNAAGLRLEVCLRCLLFSTSDSLVRLRLATLQRLPTAAKHGVCRLHHPCGMWLVDLILYGWQTSVCSTRFDRCEGCIQQSQANILIQFRMVFMDMIPHELFFKHTVGCERTPTSQITIHSSEPYNIDPTLALNRKGRASQRPREAGRRAKAAQSSELLGHVDSQGAF